MRTQSAPLTYRCRVLCVLAGAALWLAAHPAHAWSEIGHRAVASIAYQLLEPTRRAEVADLLRRHPRFAEDFQAMMPDPIRTAARAVQDEWIFQQAAYWPDIARNIPGDETTGPRAQYNRGTWHYVNFPLYLSAADRDALQPTLRVNLATEPPVDPAALPTMNVVQAIAWNTRIAGDAGKLADDQAVALAWLFHLVGDVHQPLHSTALFCVDRFPEGDRGGNQIKTRPDFNLHSVWDRFPGGEGDKAIGTAADFAAARDMATNILAEPALAPMFAAADTQQVLDWIAESRLVAESAVYTPAVLAFIRGLPKAPGEATPELALDAAYRAQGAAISRRRLAVAGRRLADLLNKLRQ